ncbi:hypothetical protein D9M72_452450 [compost metagenome]
MPGGKKRTPAAHGVSGQERSAGIAGYALGNGVGVALEVDNGAAAQQLLGAGVEYGAAAEGNDGAGGAGLFDDPGDGPRLNFPERTLAAGGEDVRDGSVVFHDHDVGVDERRPQLLSKLVADCRLANGHGSDERNGPPGRSAVPTAGRHYWPIESRDAGMLSR